MDFFVRIRWWWRVGRIVRCGFGVVIKLIFFENKEVGFKIRSLVRRMVFLFRLCILYFFCLIS